MCLLTSVNYDNDDRGQGDGLASFALANPQVHGVLVRIVMGRWCTQTWYAPVEYPRKLES